MAATEQHADAAADRRSDEALRAEVEALRTQLIQLQSSARELVSTQTRMQSLLRRMTDGIIQFESDGTISSFNPAAERIFGYTEVELLLQHGSQLFDLPERFCHDVPGFLLDYVQSTADQSAAPLVGRHREGRTVLLEVSLAETGADDPLLFDDLADDHWRPPSSYDGMLCILRDVTERRRVDDELRRHRENLEELVAQQVGEIRAAKERAEQASRSKSEFLASMSHELRTPMHAILSYSAVGLKKLATAPPDRLEHYFTRINASGARLLGMINDLLDFSKTEAGLQFYDMQCGNVEVVVADVLRECEGLADQRGLRLVHRFSLTDRLATFDADRMAQVVRNLVSNAIKFSPENSEVLITLADAGATRGDREVAGIVISVSDRGDGIPEVELERVFERFVQGSRNDRAVWGTGLGLAISREIVRAHGGEISACNHPGGGVTFQVFIPRYQEHT